MLLLKFLLLPPLFFVHSFNIKTLHFNHCDLTGKQGKSVQYDINYFCLCRPGFMYQIFPILVVLYSYLFKLSRTGYGQPSWTVK